jgi:hypothetical protein
MAPVTAASLRSLRRISVATLLLVISLPLTGAATSEQQSPTADAGDPDTPHAQGHIMVKLEPSAQAMRGLAAGSVRVTGGEWIEVPVPPGSSAAEYAEYMATRPGVDTAEVDPVLTSQASPPFTSPDLLYANGALSQWQWHLHAANVGTAWLSTVGAGVRVAVLDTGVSEGSDGFCTPFVAEYDAFNIIAGPGAASDGDGHGSHVAGSIAQCSDNLAGGAGMAPEATIMPVRVIPNGSASTVARGIDWAVANGARVINMSLGCATCSSLVLNDAIGRAAAAGVVMIAASGNSPVDVFYPANHPDVMGVGASTRAGSVASYSARGIGLDLVAPGGEVSASSTTYIWQDTTAGYEGLVGTSMASAHVSGAAALMISRFPTANPLQVRNALSCSAVDMGSPGWDTVSGFGRVDAGAAVERLRLMMESGTVNCIGQAAHNATFGALQVNSGFWRLYKGQPVASFFYGNPGDVGFMGDWNCDGIDTPGLYRQSDGFAYLRNSNSQGVADVRFFFGNPGDLPLAGDFDGDGCDTLSLYRPSEGRFYIINRLGSGDSGLGVADHAYYFGDPGDAPFMGDWNADGIDTPGLRRPSNGFVYLRQTNDQGNAHVEYFYGNPGDVVFTGDWDDDGDDTLGLYRPSTGTIYLRNSNSTGVADITVGVGQGMHPVAGEY